HRFKRQWYRASHSAMDAATGAARYSASNAMTVHATASGQPTSALKACQIQLCPLTWTQTKNTSVVAPVCNTRWQSASAHNSPAYTATAIHHQPYGAKASGSAAPAMMAAPARQAPLVHPVLMGAYFPGHWH